MGDEKTNEKYSGGTVCRENAIQGITNILSEAMCEIISIGFQDNDSNKSIIIVVRNPEKWGKIY
jgi:hypothetical protein